MSIKSSLHCFSSSPDSKDFTNKIKSLSSSTSPSGISNSNSVSSSSSSFTSNLSLFTLSILSSSLISYKIASILTSLSSSPLFSTFTLILIVSFGENSSLLSGSSIETSKSPIVPLLHLFKFVKLLNASVSFTGG